MKNEFVFQYIEGDKTIQRREKLTQFCLMMRFRLVKTFSRKRDSQQVAKVFIPFFDDQYEMDEGFEYDYDLPQLTEKQTRTKQKLNQ